MQKDVEHEIDIICNHCEHKMNHNEIKLYPTKTELFTRKNFENLELSGESENYLLYLRKKDKEMRLLQKKLQNDYDGTVNKIINMINASNEKHDSKRYKTHFLNVMKSLRNNLDEEMREQVDNYTVYPGLVFGHYEFSYKGPCTNCHKLVGTIWRGSESLKQSVRLKQKAKNDRTTFNCSRCKNIIIAEYQFWYAYSVDSSGNFGNYMQTICKNCHRVQNYPYEFQTAGAIHVNSGGPHTKLHKNDLEDWMYPRVILYISDGHGTFTDTQVFNLTAEFARECANVKEYPADD